MRNACWSATRAGCCAGGKQERVPEERKDREDEVFGQELLMGGLYAAVGGDEFIRLDDCGLSFNRPIHGEGGFQPRLVRWRTVVAMVRSMISTTRRLGYRMAKRAFDLCFSITAVAICLLPGTLLMIAISLESRG